MAHLSNGACSQVVGACSTLLSGEAGDEGGYLGRARAHFELHSYSSALADVKKAISLGLKTCDIYTMAGKAATKLGKFEDALAYHTQALKLRPGDPEAVNGLREIQKILIKDYEQQSVEEQSVISALKFCSQDPYPGDDQLLKLEKEILQKKYKVSAEVIPEKPHVGGKSPIELDAGRCALTGQQCKVQGFTDEALYYFNLAVETDPYDMGFRLLRAIMNKDLGNYRDAIQDFWLIPKQKRGVDVWKMGGEVFKMLQLPVLAEFWLRKATKLAAEENEAEELAVAFQQIRMDRLYGPLTADYGVHIEFTKYGKAVIASEDIPANAVIFKDCPIVQGQSLATASRSPTCSNCGRSMFEPQHYFGEDLTKMKEKLRELLYELWPPLERVQCDRCDREQYCSETCKQEAWTNYHSAICPSSNPAANLLYEVCENDGFATNPATGNKEEYWGGHYNPIILVKIWAYIVSEARRLMEADALPQPSQEHWARAKAPYRRFISFGKANAVKKNPLFYELVREMFLRTTPSYSISEAEFDGRYYQATCNLQAFNPHTTPYQALMEKIPARADVGVLALLKHLDRAPPYAELAGLFPLHACINHSCENSAEITDGEVSGKPGIWVMSKRAIARGEEVFISYLDAEMSRKLRRAWLYRSFNFWCHCRRCQFEGDDAETCTHCLTRSPRKSFPACGCCKKAWYCSVKCQRASWQKGHKSICRPSPTNAENPNS